MDTSDEATHEDSGRPGRADAGHDTEPDPEARSSAASAARSPSVAGNVAANVVGQFVFVLSGFVLPRLVFDRIGVEMLGVWDFGWALVAHLTLVGGGVLSAVSREVAQYTGNHDVARLRNVISTCFVLFTVVGVIVAGVTATAAAFVSVFLPGLSPAAVADARWVVVLLGLSAAVHFPFHVFNGVITGHQRYVLHNVIMSGTHVATIAGVLAVLLLGLGLPAMAGVYLLGELAAGGIKLYFARRICPEWRIARRYVTRDMLRHVLTFGGKTFLRSVSTVVLYQTNLIFVGYFLGVESVALFARPRSLVRSVDRIIQKVAMVFTPRASHLQASGDPGALLQSMHQATQYILYVALPSVLLLALLGGPLIEVWMGGKFADGMLIAVLAVGHLAMFAQRGAYHVLMGMARHGWPAFAEFVASLVGIGLTVLLVGYFKLGLLGAALGLVVPMTLVNLFVTPIYACRVLDASPLRFWYRAAAKPLLLAVPFGAVLVLTRLLLAAGPLLTVAVGVAAASVVYLVLLWQFALTGEQRQRLLRRLSPFGAPRVRAASPSSTSANTSGPGR